MTLHLSVDPEADVCPMCDSHLGHPRGATRRQIVFSATPGVFRWRCPDCRGVWQVDRGQGRLGPLTHVGHDGGGGASPEGGTASDLRLLVSG